MVEAAASVVTAAALALELGCSRQSIAKWIREGLLPLPGERVGRRALAWRADEVRPLVPGLRDLLELRTGQRFVRRVDRRGDYELLDFNLGERTCRLRSAGTGRLSIVDLTYHRRSGWRPKGFLHARPARAVQS